MPRAHANKILIYNHKGGVGKTTLTLNLAAALARRNHRVLLVDSDPQCNLTSYLLNDETVDELLEDSDSANGETIWSALRPVHEAEGKVRYIDPIKVFPEVFLLPGDIRLSEFEEDLESFWRESQSRKSRGLRGVCALSSMVNRVIDEYDFDFVFFDAGPNIGPLNRSIFLDSEFLIVPAACDLFSLRALRTLGRTITKWIRDWRLIREINEDSGEVMLDGNPRLLGYVAQRFRIYRGQPTAGYAEYLPRIERRVHADIVVPLRRINPQLAPGTSAAMKLGLIKDFGTMATDSQSQGVPISDVAGASSRQKDEALITFDNLAKRIEARIKGLQGRR